MKRMITILLCIVVISLTYTAFSQELQESEQINYNHFQANLKEDEKVLACKTIQQSILTPYYFLASYKRLLEEDAGNKHQAEIEHLEYCIALLEELIFNENDQSLTVTEIEVRMDLLYYLEEDSDCDLSRAIYNLFLQKYFKLM